MDRSNNKGLLKNTTPFSLLYKLMDAICILVLLSGIASWYPKTQWNDRFFLMGMIAVVIFYLTAEMGGLYRSSWQGVPLRTEALRLFLVWLGTALGLLLIAYLTKSSAEYSRVVVTLWLIGVPVILVGWRFIKRVAMYRLHRKGYNSRSVAVAGAGELGMRVKQAIESTPHLGLDFVGFYDDRENSEQRLTWDGALEGDFEDMVDRAKRGDVDMICIALPVTAQDRIMSLVDQLTDTTVSVYLIPDFFVFSLFHGQWTNISGLHMVSIFETPFLGVNGWVKRAQDVVLSSVILAFMCIPMLMIALAVKISSPGPVIFKQRRYGIDGKVIDVWKYRSMRVLEDNENVPQATRNDPRVTKVGAFLRQTSLDELPQFINVLKGDMSIVGPRPHAVAHNEEYRRLISGYMLRHAVKPGITGWAQVNGWRGETDTLDKMEKRIEYDLWYIQNWSFWLDIKIVMMTILKGFTGKFAY